jgi:hypothetical protein
MQLELNQLIVPPGHQLLLKNVNWQMIVFIFRIKPQLEERSG